MSANWLLFSVKRDNPISSLYSVHMVTKGREVGRWRGPARSALNFRWGGLMENCRPDFDLGHFPSHHSDVVREGMMNIHASDFQFLLNPRTLLYLSLYWNDAETG